MPCLCANWFARQARQGVVCGIVMVGGSCLLMRLFPLYDTSIEGVCLLASVGTLSRVLSGFGLGLSVGTMGLLYASIKARNTPCKGATPCNDS